MPCEYATYPHTCQASSHWNDKHAGACLVTDSFIYYVAMSFIFSYNLKADLSSPHREDSNDTTLTFSNAVFRFPYTANNAVNAKFGVRGRVTSKGLPATLATEVT